eukprot:3455353-Prorocentrum_lima.AAC.1
MSIDQVGVTSFQNEADSQGDPFEAARGQTNRFSQDDLPDESGAPICAHCDCEMPGKRFIVVMET